MTTDINFSELESQNFKGISKITVPGGKTGMASNKTPNLHLDIWAPDDYFKRAELNPNFSKIDDKIGDLRKDVSSHASQLAEKAPKKKTDAWVDVKEDFGAKGNGVADDTTAIQAAINSIPNGGKIYIPNGTYMINAVTGIKPKSKQTITLSQNAKLKVIPNNSGSYRIFDIVYVSDVTIEGGYLEGDKDTHLEATGESGHGIVIGSQASNTVLRDIQISQMWGDGIYMGGAYASTNSKIYNVVCDQNRRQGLSITYADGVVVRDSSFINTSGTLPEAGIDIEPNTNNYTKNIVLDNVKCIGNRSGLQILGISEKTSKINVINSEFNNNRDYGVSITHATDVTLRGCTMSGNRNGLMMARDNNNISLYTCNFLNSYSHGANLTTTRQRLNEGGTKNILFDFCIFKNNGRELANRYDGCIIDNFDNRNVIDRITFNQCQFIDTQATPTQRYGLSVSNKASITNIILGYNNYYTGNVTGGKSASGTNTSEIIVQPVT
ncbi:right-handed parallel beta-helix repeat-containing protein [Priestia megaterium]|uniref:right-handed parallel beta-helix repeat-containing protein n=1 Tax=Priestia megaterium TaxID=1404 RepID=UPI000680EC26|nr:glycosyl hydrolase family 28-related protein [Priestia megaterium]